MSEVRCLHRAGVMPVRCTNAVPTVNDRIGAAERREIMDFLEASQMRPLYVSPATHRHNIETAIDTMTLAERVYIEIEMQERRTVMYSSDYDPLRG